MMSETIYWSEALQVCVTVPRVDLVNSRVTYPLNEMEVIGFVTAHEWGGGRTWSVRWLDLEPLNAMEVIARVVAT